AAVHGVRSEVDARAEAGRVARRAAADAVRASLPARAPVAARAAVQRVTRLHGAAVAAEVLARRARRHARSLRAIGHRGAADGAPHAAVRGVGHLVHAGGAATFERGLARTRPIDAALLGAADVSAAPAVVAVGEGVHALFARTLELARRAAGFACGAAGAGVS